MEGPVDNAFLDSITDPTALYENAPCGYISFTADGKIVKLNQTMLDWLGYEREEVVHKLYFKDLITRGGQIYYEMFYFPLLLIQNRVNEINFDHVRKDGTRFPGLLNSNVVNDENGRLIVVNATVFNITDRKKYENELLEAKRLAEAERGRFETLANFLPEMIWTANDSGQINYVNRRFAEFFGIPQGIKSAEQILPKIHKKDRFKLIWCWKKSVGKDTKFQIEIRIQNLDGSFQWHLIRALPNKQLGGNSKWMGSCNNIDQHVNTIQQLDEFISIVSHELKTPITTLRASLQLMKKFVDKSKDAVFSKFHEQAARSVIKITDLVGDLLNAGSIKSGHIKLNISSFNVKHLLLNTCPHVKVTQNHNLVVNCPDGLEVTADEHRIDQVLVNFVNNAIKYAPDSKDIFLTAEAAGDEIRISVRDTGPGIPADKLPHVFERYYRASNAGSGYTGLGLGLYICSEIVKRHDGRIGVDSVLGEGTTFWFTLPRKN